MNLNYLFNTVYSFLINNQLIALGISIALAIWFWKKPYGFLKCALAILALLAAIYVFNFFNEASFVGFQKKQEITTEREEKLLEK